MLPHPLDLVALLLGVFFTLRQMDTAQRDAKNYPSVAAETFERWRALARRAYRLGASACFGKVLIDIVAAWSMRRVPMPRALQIGIGVSLDVAWVVLVLLSFFAVRRAHAYAREIGVERSVPPQT